MFLVKLIFSLFLVISVHVTYAKNIFKSTKVHASWLYLKPMSNNHTYAFYVAGTQPYSQSWYAQSFNPSYSSAFEIGLESALIKNVLNSSASWLHFYSNDASSIQGNDTREVKNIAFVGPPFEMSPQVFGIRRADSNLKYNYDNVNLNLEKLFSRKEWGLSGKISAGLNILNLKQNMVTVFSDMVGAEATPYSYALPADPLFSFQIKTSSNFIGAGPELGFNGEINL